MLSDPDGHWDYPLIYRLNTPAILEQLRSCIASFFLQRFADDDSWIDKVPGALWQARVARAQDALNQERYTHAIVNDLRAEFSELLESDDILVQSSAYLRAARPAHDGDVVSWHRESMFGGPPECLNVWLPVYNVNVGNALRYVPGSQRIPLSDLIIGASDESRVAQGSPGHRIGLLYAPKAVVGGVDFASAKPLLIDPYDVAVFSGELVHGAAVNRSNDVRLSIDFRVVAAEYLTYKPDKAHVTSGKPYFEPLEPS